jgi:ankyrin repeat protein
MGWLPMIHFAQTIDNSIPLFHCGVLDSMYQLVEQGKLLLDTDLGDANTPLTLSCQCGSNYLIKKYNISVNYVCPVSRLPLIIDVISSKNTALIDYFIQQKVDLNVISESGKRGLDIAAAIYQDSLFLQYLLDNGALLLNPHENGAVLRHALNNPNPDIFFFLLQKYEGIPLQEVMKDTSLLEFAALYGRFEVVRLLVQDKDFRQSPILDRLPSQPFFTLPLTNRLLHHLANQIAYEYEANNSKTILKEGQLLLDDLIAKHLKIHLINEQGETILFTLAKTPLMISYLADRKMDMNVKNVQGQTVLKKVIDELMEQIYQQEQLHYKFDSPTIAPLLERIDELILHGAIVDNTHLNSKQYFFFEAVQNNHLQLVELLVQRGYDPNLRDTDGKTALDIATQSEFIGLKEFLMNLNKK